MNHLAKKTIEVSRGYTYTYYTSPAKDGKLTVLLVHGWPDSAEQWGEVIEDYLVPEGYGVVAIDCLGYAGTSKPTDYNVYNFKDMSKDVIDILDAEKIDKVISLGHDWGCGLSQRVYNFYPERTLGVVFVNVSYIIPGQPFDVDAINELTKQIFGKSTYHYWKLFAGDDGPEILHAHIESMWCVAHGKPETWLDTLCEPDGVRNFLLEDRRQPTEPYATEERKKAWIERMKRDKFEGPQCWYKAMMYGAQDEANKSIAPENIKINVPALFFGGKRDFVCRPELMGPAIEAGLVPDLKTVLVDSGHWSMHANPKEFGEAIVGWLKEKF